MAARTLRVARQRSRSSLVRSASCRLDRRTSCSSSHLHLAALAQPLDLRVQLRAARAPAVDRHDGGRPPLGRRLRRQQAAPDRDDPLDLGGGDAHRRAGQQPGAVLATGQLARGHELAERGRHGGAAGADELAEHAVRERHRHGHAIRGDAPPALGKVPEEGEQPTVHAVELRDGLRDGQPRGALADAIDDRRTHLGVPTQLDGQTAVEQRQPHAAEHVPADRMAQQRRAVLGVPRADHVARAEQLGADDVRDEHLAGENALEHEQPDVLGPDAGHLPGARLEEPDRDPQLALRGRQAVVGQQLSQIGIELQQRCGLTVGHGLLPASGTRL